MIWGGVADVAALAHFLSFNVWGEGEGGVVYGVGAVYSGRFVMLMIMEENGFRFFVEGGINS